MGWRLEGSQLISSTIEYRAQIWFSFIDLLILLPKHFLLTPLSHYKNEKKNHRNEQGLVCCVMSCGRDLGDGELSKQLLDQTVYQSDIISQDCIYLLIFEEW